MTDIPTTHGKDADIQVMSVEQFEKIITSWKQEEILWREREAELLREIESLHRAPALTPELREALEIILAECGSDYCDDGLRDAAATLRVWLEQWE